MSRHSGSFGSAGRLTKRDTYNRLVSRLGVKKHLWTGTHGVVGAKEVGDVSTFAELLDYEVRCAKRYDRTVTVVLISDSVTDAAQRTGAQGHFRSSDAVFQLRRGTAVIMSGTSPLGAVKAVERLQPHGVPAAGFRFDVINYPRDGEVTQDLLDACAAKWNTSLANPQGTVEREPMLDPSSAGNDIDSGLRYVGGEEGFF